MKETTLIKSAALTGAALLTGLAFAGEPAAKSPIECAPSPGLDISFGVGYTNEYVFRGHNRGDDLFEASLTASGSGSLLGLGDVNVSAGLWLGTYTRNFFISQPGLAVTNLPAIAATEGANEMRINLQASKSLGSLDVNVGVTNYSFFGGISNQADIMEPYVSIGTNFAGFDVGAGLYDTEDADDPYYEITVGRSVDLGSLSINLTGVVGTLNEFDDTFYGISARLPLAVSDNITVSPHVSGIFGDTRSGDDEVTAGVNVVFGF